MKFNKFVAILSSAMAICACENKLPYDLDGVEHGVMIHIAKVEGASMSLSTNMDEGDYRVALFFSDYQGDCSMMKEAQVMAVYTDGQKNKKSAIVATGITELPDTVTIDIKEACRLMGITTLNVGDRMEFTPCYTLKSGTQVDGWSEYSGFNNSRFSALSQGDGYFQYRASYTAFAPFVLENYLGVGEAFGAGGEEDYGPVSVSLLPAGEMPDPEWIPSGITTDDLVGILAEGDLFYGGDAIKMWINKKDYTLIIPDQVISPDFTFGAYGTYDGEIAECEGEVDNLHSTISFYIYSIWGPYSLGDDEFVLQMGGDE